MRKGKGGRVVYDGEGLFGKNVVDEVTPNRAIRFIYHTIAPVIGGYPLTLMNAKNDEIALAVLEPIPLGVAVFLVGERLDIRAYLRSFPSIAQTVLFRPVLLPAFDGVNILIMFCSRPFMPAADMPMLDHNEHRLTEFVAFPSRKFLEGRDWSVDRSHNYVWQATTQDLIQQ